MVFTVLVAGDVGGQTHNFELPFGTLPTVQELRANVAEVFQAVDGGSRFAVGKLQVYDTALQRWADLGSGRQLRDRCQVYAHEATGEAPAPCPPQQYLRAPTPQQPQAAAPPEEARGLPRDPAPPPAAPQPGARQAGTGSPLHESQEDKAQRVFDAFDTQRTRRIAAADFVLGLQRLGVALQSATADRLFERADSEGNGWFGFSQWLRFCAFYPRLLESLRLRQLQREEEVQLAEAAEAANERLQTAQQQAAGAADDADRAAAAADRQRNVQLHAEQRAAEAAAGESSAAGTAEEAAAEARRCSERLQDARRDHQHAREREQAAAADLTAASAVAAAAANAIPAADAAAAACLDRVRALEAELAQARRAAEEAISASDAARISLGEAQQGEAAARAAAAQAQQDAAAAGEGALRAEAAQAGATERELRAGAEQREARYAAARERRAAAEQGCECEELQRQAAAAGELAMTAAARVEAAAQAAAAAAEKLRGTVAAREREEDEELSLLDEEIRLREQRDALDRQEERLGAAHGRFRSARLSPVSPTTALGASRPAPRTSASLSAAGSCSASQLPPLPPPSWRQQSGGRGAAPSAPRDAPETVVRGLQDAVAEASQHAAAARWAAAEAAGSQRSSPGRRT
eukprot:TRINITY_DN10706_c0_g1_i1.p1 TRINITY_DN10706_c0_g1~~TRINITY_DN10706_c0_g1_i1.p1  ORF type:complete len:664 (+),score=233.33 TRINITY_DN10706_c0_g1_i1:80-1993(+)